MSGETAKNNAQLKREDERAEFAQRDLPEEMRNLKRRRFTGVTGYSLLVKDNVPSALVGTS